MSLNHTEFGPDDFEPKRIAFEFDGDLPKHWNATPNLTYFFNSLGILSPSFERLFILSVLNFRRNIKGGPLEKAMKAFLGQEAQHDHQIRRFTQVLEENHNYPIKALEQKHLEFCKRLNDKCSPMFQLAMTMGAEHLIASFSDFHLRDPAWLSSAHPQAQSLWRWHAIEEIEHKSVAFDIYHHLGGTYRMKVAAMVVVTSVIGWMWLYNWFVMAKKDKQLLKFSFWVDTFRFHGTRPGLFTQLVKPMFAYFKPSFHPWRANNNALVKTWRDKLNPQSKSLWQAILSEQGVD